MKLGEILVSKEILTELELKQLLTEANTNKTKLGSLLIEKEILTEAGLVECLSLQGNKVKNANVDDINLDLIKKLDYAFLRKKSIVPLSFNKKVLDIIVSDVLDIEIDTELKNIFDCVKINKYLDTRKSIQQTLEEFYVINSRYLKVSHKVTLTYKNNNEIYLNEVFALAVKEGASDIHFRYDILGNVIVEIRTFGILSRVGFVEHSKANLLIRSLKQRANMSPDVKEAQDSSFNTYLKELNMDINMRCSAIPTISTSDSDKFVVRIMGSSKDIKPINELGYLKEHTDYMELDARKGVGLNLFVGATGSGKSTSIYSLLQRIHNGEKNIITIEDPVELKMDGITQYKINEKNPLETVLSKVMRQDPDIIYMGEIRDRLTADVAISSSLTGHNVWSTLHAKDVVSAIARLIDFGMSPLNVSQTLNYIIYQRLVKVLCPVCRKALNKDVYTKKVQDTLASEGNITSVNTKLLEKIMSKDLFTRGDGCETCKDTGYAGRTLVYEILKVNKKVSQSILSGNFNDIKEGLQFTLEDSILSKIDGIDFEDIEFILYDY